MNIIFFVIGLLLIIIARIQRYIRIVKGESKVFDGYTSTEAIIQWSGVIFVVLGLIVSIKL